jgi:hypothetical protein
MEAENHLRIWYSPHTSLRAPVAQRIEHLTTDQKVWGSNPYGRTTIEPLFNSFAISSLNHFQ